MPLGDELVVVVTAPVATMVKTRVPLDPEPSLAIAVTVTVPAVPRPCIIRGIDVPPPATDHDTGTFAVS